MRGVEVCWPLNNFDPPWGQQDNEVFSELLKRYLAQFWTDFTRAHNVRSEDDLRQCDSR